MSRPPFWLLLLGLAACADIEGNDPGECEDGADNDSDGYFDCDDRDCFGAPVCRDGDDDTGDDDTADDDDTGDDDTGDDDTGDDDAADDDDGDDDTTPVGDGVTPVIDLVTYVYESSVTRFTFAVTATDPDGNFGVPLLLWSVDGAPQPPVSVGSVPLQGDAQFTIQMNGATTGQTYQVLFAIRDADGRQSDGYLVSAVAN